MFHSKKTVTRARKEKSNEDYDCARVILQGKQMGFGAEEMLRMRWGEAMDYLITTNELIEERERVREEAFEKQKTEKRGSLMDL